MQDLINKIRNLICLSDRYDWIDLKYRLKLLIGYAPESTLHTGSRSSNYQDVWGL